MIGGFGTHAVHIVGIAAKRRGEFVSDEKLILGRLDWELQGVGLHDGSLEKSNAGRNGQMNGNRRGTSGLAEQSDVIRISTVGSDVSLDPTKHFLLVKNTVVTSSTSNGQETQGAQTVTKSWLQLGFLWRQDRSKGDQTYR